MNKNFIDMKATGISLINYNNRWLSQNLESETLFIIKIPLKQQLNMVKDRE